MVYLKTDLGTRSEELWSETGKEEKRVINESACSDSHNSLLKSTNFDLSKSDCRCLFESLSMKKGLICGCSSQSKDLRIYSSYFTLIITKNIEN